VEIVVVVIALVVTGIMLAPPRGDERKWLAGALLVWWVAIMAVGLWRGVLAGYEAWLALLSLMAALAALLVVWSAVNLRRGKREE
jgi:hypothetical protein